MKHEHVFPSKIVIFTKQTAEQTILSAPQRNQARACLPGLSAPPAESRGEGSQLAFVSLPSSVSWGAQPSAVLPPHAPVPPRCSFLPVPPGLGLTQSPALASVSHGGGISGLWGESLCNGSSRAGPERNPCSPALPPTAHPVSDLRFHLTLGT